MFIAGLILSLQIHAEEVTINTAIEIRWKSTLGVINQVQYSTNLSSGVWQDFGTPILGDGSTNQVFDSTRESARKYYQVITKEPSVNTNIIGVFEIGNYPNPDSGQFQFNTNDTFSSDFIESSRSISSGTYTYLTNTLTLVFIDSTNPYLIGETEVYNNVIVSNDLYFIETDAIFYRQYTNSVENIAGTWEMVNHIDGGPFISDIIISQTGTNIVVTLEGGDFTGYVAGTNLYFSGSAESTGTMEFEGSIQSSTYMSGKGFDIEDCHRTGSGWDWTATKQ